MPARADALDGSWCSDDGRSLTIDGPKIRTPTGAKVTGEYARHSFRYVGSIGDPEEAHDVRMLLWNEDDLRIDRIVDGVKQPEESWHRCKPIA
jgi:hypothetical protein